MLGRSGGGGGETRKFDISLRLCRCTVKDDEWLPGVKLMCQSVHTIYAVY